MTAAAGDALERLRVDIRDGGAHTVRVCFADHYGVLRGRRMVVQRFLAGASAPQAFCDGALVWDIRCDIFEEAEFSNYRTGYPDLYIRPDLATLRLCGWNPGEYMVLGDAYDGHGRALEVAPRWVLRRVLDRIPESVLVSARLELRVPDEAVAGSWAPGYTPPFADRLLLGLQRADVPVLALQWSRSRRVMTLSFAPVPALAAADALVTARTAAREIAAVDDVELTAMPRLEDGDAPTLLQLGLLTAAVAPDDVTTRLHDVELLLRPLPLGHAGTPVAGPPSGRNATVLAASDANPYVAVAAALAAGWEEAAPAPANLENGYRAAIARFKAAEWARDWLGSLFVHDALALAEREAALRDTAISDWDLRRYWECG